jgi:hypothetical protein
MDLEIYEHELEALVQATEGLEHLRVKTWGKHLLFYSGKKTDIHNHARFTMLTRGVWALSLPDWNGRWEKTPFTGTLKDLFATLTQTFSWHLSPVP